ncbi:MAG: hypothetical protein EA339_04475 [Rhodobacteraceae bacterium]|nr:MAG: hypothetical protein EA339_04475 [Paracoccaceae bacterium]
MGGARLWAGKGGAVCDARGHGLAPLISASVSLKRQARGGWRLSCRRTRTGWQRGAADRLRRQAARQSAVAVISVATMSSIDRSFLFAYLVNA